MTVTQMTVDGLSVAVPADEAALLVEAIGALLRDGHDDAQVLRGMRDTLTAGLQVIR